MDVCTLVIHILACASHGPVLDLSANFASNPSLLVAAFSGVLFDLFYFVPFEPGFCRLIVIGISIEIRPSGSWALPGGWALRTDGRSS